MAIVEEVLMEVVPSVYRNIKGDNKHEYNHNQEGLPRLHQSRENKLQHFTS